MAGEQLLLINPRRRKRRAHVRRRRIRNTRRHHRRVARVHHRRRRHYARLANPRRHRRRSVSHRRRRRLRNPWQGVGNLNRDVLTPALIGGAGAIALQLGWNAFGSLLPTSITGNQLLTVAAQAAGAIGLGWLAGKAIGKNNGDYVALGGVLVVAVNYVSGLISSAPGLAGMGRRRLGAYMPGQGGPRLFPPRGNRRSTMGAYLPGQGLALGSLRGRGGMGRYAAMNPAPFLSGGSSDPMACGGMGMF